eukprot:Rhum_TRINITY_DN1208_c0_g1::Rhum_TRINITY_DN1208_c0_g1_i1::g.3698::m.3698/K13348/MPV17; protein Mpv17
MTSATKAGRTWQHWYSRLNARHPLRVKAITTAVMFGLGDVLCQTIEHAEYDTLRTARMASIGMLWTGPVLHFYFLRLSQPPFASLSPLLLTVFDQAVGAVCLTTSFFFLMGSLQGALAGSSNPVADGIAVVTDELVPTMLSNWCIWPLLNFVSFSYVPVQYRVLWTSFWGVFWNAYLSYRANLRSSSVGEEL